MAIRETFIINQALPSLPNLGICQSEAPCRPASNTPSRFRRKKGYTGKTAQTCNQNYKSMPKEF